MDRPSGLIARNRTTFDYLCLYALISVYLSPMLWPMTSQARSIRANQHRHFLSLEPLVVLKWFKRHSIGLASAISQNPLHDLLPGLWRHKRSKMNFDLEGWVKFDQYMLAVWHLQNCRPDQENVSAIRLLWTMWTYFILLAVTSQARSFWANRNRHFPSLESLVALKWFKLHSTELTNAISRHLLQVPVLYSWFSYLSILYQTMSDQTRFYQMSLQRWKNVQAVTH